MTISMFLGRVAALYAVTPNGKSAGRKLFVTGADVTRGRVISADARQ